MELVELNSTPIEALPLALFKGHLRLGSGFTDDGLQDEILESYLRASMAAIEARTGKYLLERRVSWTLTRWTQAEAQPLPIAPVREVELIQVATAEGVASDIDPERYVLQRDTHRPKVLSRGTRLPDIPIDGVAQVIFFAGFGATWIEVPADLRQAVFLLAAHYYENRDDLTGAGGVMPFGVVSLLEPHRTIRVFGARQ